MPDNFITSQKWAIITQDGRLVRTVATPSIDVHPASDEGGEAEACEGMIVAAVDRAPSNNEVPVLDGGKFVEWKVCPVRDQADADRRILLRFSDPIQNSIYAEKEAEAIIYLASSEAGPIIKAEAEAVGLPIEMLCKQIVDRANQDRALLNQAIASREAARRAEKRAAVRLTEARDFVQNNMTTVTLEAEAEAAGMSAREFAAQIVAQAEAEL